MSTQLKVYPGFSVVPSTNEDRDSFITKITWIVLVFGRDAVVDLDGNRQGVGDFKAWLDDQVGQIGLLFGLP